jgi:Fe-S-cluster containining protein
MEALVQIDEGDRRLLAALADTMAEAERRSGEWLACRPGCTECCMGPFGITQLDARRLREGLRALAADDPLRAAAVRSRAEAYIRAVAPIYPGDSISGELRDEDALPSSLDDIPCPALDPASGCCDLYSARPVTCRTFGPATLIDEATLGACELCYVGATEEQMTECAVKADPERLEDALVAAMAAEGAGGMTIVAYALVAPEQGKH